MSKRAPAKYKPIHLCTDVIFNVRLTIGQRDKLGHLGGSKWVRAAIDAADMASSVRKQQVRPDAP